MVEHELTDAGCTRVVHLNSAQQRRVRRENEQSGHSSERSDQHVGVARVSSGDAQSRHNSRRNGLSRSSLAVQQHSGEEEDHSQQSRTQFQHTTQWHRRGFRTPERIPMLLL